ncbi:hypothetical protein MSIMFB_04713 [Mycobacterium simulans]|uniref:Uncharacterized protein n=1 Tax=Mycobacterium simulans TaxID=627089 RepID=A0A7Z7IRN4_9MYCO|nr:hypothetical protein [Mycobacterium simulans]SOJ57236.1 hypothetical protein MSIMFB_04713 [Mycobacterium simulans]SON60759.1 hypothetical protein MSIMFI_02260 [Mycobacterium simulans]
MDAFGVFDEVLGDYESYVNAFLDIQDERVRDEVEKEIQDGLLWPQPWLAPNPAFESGGTVSELADQGVLHPKARDIFRVRINDRMTTAIANGGKGWKSFADIPAGSGSQHE